MLCRIERGLRVSEIISQYPPDYSPFKYDPLDWTYEDWLIAIEKLADHYNCWGYVDTDGQRNFYTIDQDRQFISDVMTLVFASRRAFRKTPSVGRDARKLIKWLSDVEVGVYKAKPEK